jgi:hypothetical protein
VGACHHGMALPHVADGDGLQIRRVAVNVFSKLLRTADKRWSVSLSFDDI